MAKSNFLKGKKFLFSALYFGGFAAFATFALDFVFYSEKIGFTNTEIGLIFAVKLLMGILFQPLYGFLCDYLKSTRIVLLFMCVLSALLSALIPLAPNKLILLCIDFAYTFSTCALMPLIDNWVVSESVNDSKIAYGKVRLWGSIGFAITAAIYGRITMFIDISNIYYGRAIFFVLLIILICLNNSETAHVPGSSQKEKPDIAALFRKKEYWLFFTFLFIFFFPVMASGNFLPRLLLEMGTTNQTIALFNSLNAILEIPFFLGVRRLSKKIGPRGLMLIGGIFMTLRLVGLSSASSVPLLLAANFCFVPYITLFMPGFIFYSHSIAPNNAKAFALTSLQGFAMGLAGMLGSYFSGLIVDYQGIRYLYLYGSILCIIGVVLFVFSSLLLRERRN